MDKLGTDMTDTWKFWPFASSRVGRTARTFCFTAVSAAMLGAISLDAAPAAAQPPASGRLSFKVMREGSQIGTHVLTFQKKGDELLVNIAIRLKVTLGGLITVFRYTHDNHEVWRDDRLVAISTKTDDDGTEDFVKGKAAAAGIKIDGSAGDIIAPPTILPTSYWEKDGLLQSTELLNTQTGALMKVNVNSLGRETILAAGKQVQATRYRISGDLNLDVWYDDAGTWVKLQFKAKDGSLVDYILS